MIVRTKHTAVPFALALLAWQALSPHAARATHSDVVIGEFRVRGPNGGSDEFVELYNRSLSPVAIGGWKLRASNSGGTVGTRATIPAGVMLGAGCRYLLTNSSTSGGPYSGPVPGDQTYATGITDDGGLALTDAADAVLDQAGMSAGSAFKEGTPLANLGSSNLNRGYERKPGGSSGSGTDTDDNSADFQLLTPSDPQNLASTCVGSPVPTNPSGVGAANPGAVIAGDTTLLTVTVTPGSNPTSTGLGVRGDLSAIGGSSDQTFSDSGTDGDVTPGDNVFSFQAVVAAGTTPGGKSLPAQIADAQGRTGSTNIALTVQSLVQIHEIQGSGSTSPKLGQAVLTRGIVTARKSNGFFLQTAHGQDDGDPSTSQGILVFTGSTPPPSALVGSEVRVSGTVTEFVPSADPLSPSLTELNSPSVTQLSTGNTLPEPVVLTAADTDPAGSIEQLEHLEGMRVRVNSLTAVAPTQGSVNEPNATSTSNGVFYGVITGVDRPFRERGVQVPDPLPAGAPLDVPRFDANPERLRVDSDGQVGAPRIEVSSGAIVNSLVGPVDYAFRTYTILPDPGSPVVTGVGSAVPVPEPADDEATVAAFNMERFFDTVNDPAISEPVLTQTAFNNRLKKGSLLIRNVMLSPDILGVEEVENLSTLQAIADRVNADAVASGESNPNYQAFLEEGNDIGGIDVGFLVKSARVTVVDVTQEGKFTTFTNPNCGTQEILNDRPSLVLRAVVHGADGMELPLTVIGNHLRSLNGLTSTNPDGSCSPAAGTGGARVRAKRNAQAEFLASLIQARQSADPRERIVVMGDMNAFEFNDGYVDSMGTIKGSPTPFDQVVLAGDDLVDPNLTSLVELVPAERRYSYSFDGNAQVLDHVLVSESLRGLSRGLVYGRVDADFPDSFRNDANRPERLSDHDPAVAYFRFPAADLSLNKTASAGSVLSGSTLTYTLRLANAGPDEALNVTLADPLPAGTTFEAIAAPEGLSCTAPTVGSGGTVTCEATSLSAGDEAVVLVGVRTACTLTNGTVLVNIAAGVSQVRDPNLADNQSSVSTTISNPPPTVSGLVPDRRVLWPPSHQMVDVALSYQVSDNCDPAPACQVAVASDEPVQGTGDGDSAPDWEVVDSHHVRLRAERAGAGDGRVYTLTVTCQDSAGGTSSASTFVGVPYSQR